MVTASAVPAELPEVFVSYSHRDETWKDDFLPHIRMLEQLGHLREWHDRDIGLGELWFDEIAARLTWIIHEGRVGLPCELKLAAGGGGAWGAVGRV